MAQQHRNLPEGIAVDFNRSVSLNMFTDRPYDYHDQVAARYPNDDHFVTRGCACGMTTGMTAIMMIMATTVTIIVMTATGTTELDSARFSTLIRPAPQPRRSFARYALSRQHCLYFFPLPQGHGLLRPTFGAAAL